MNSIKSGKFNKKLFSKLLRQAMGDRNMNTYAAHTGVSLTYVSELVREKRKNAPKEATIRKLASKAYNGVTYTDLMIAAGHWAEGGVPAGFAENKMVYSLEIPEHVAVKLRKWEEQGLGFDILEKLVEYHLKIKQSEVSKK